MKINGKTVRVFDNGGKTFDRYTIFIDGSYYGMSINPFSPQGFSQYCGEIKEIPKPYDHLGKEIKTAKELPEDVIEAIKDRMEVR